MYDALKWKELDGGLAKVLLNLPCREAILDKGSPRTINYLTDNALIFQTTCRRQLLMMVWTMSIEPLATFTCPDSDLGSECVNALKQSHPISLPFLPAAYAYLSHCSIHPAFISVASWIGIHSRINEGDAKLPSCVRNAMFALKCAPGLGNVPCICKKESLAVRWKSWRGS